MSALVAFILGVCAGSIGLMAVMAFVFAVSDEEKGK